jgi:hypothetical protein
MIGASTREVRQFLSIRNDWNRHLYKYKDCNVEYLRNLIVDSWFYMSSRNQLNDPFDVRSDLEFVDGGIDRKAYLKRLFKEHNIRYKQSVEISRRLSSPNAIENEIRRLLEISIDTTGFHSFATSPRNLLMWSHYAQSHAGVCLVYETAKDLTTFIGALPVEYSDAFPVIQYSDQMGRDLIRKAFLTKAKDWQYEKERRIFANDRAGQYMSYAPQALVGVILGAKISSANESMVRDLLVEREARRHPPLHVYRATCQKSAYAMKVYRA